MCPNMEKWSYVFMSHSRKLKAVLKVVNPKMQPSSKEEGVWFWQEQCQISEESAQTESHQSPGRYKA